ncbi:exopolyphosphatase [Streptomyces aureoverticillatus]|uniref:exopolyphosphatase n=1 Tax=Streptomyces aureoverticillatus TaxID=66871 RepID=UPI0013DCF7C8|nr:exopolyphosphatase [Streptomyces aureoverticillatus]QIB42665.1 exopolyphosphatase [Streptomyces aureoverticillatus]
MEFILDVGSHSLKLYRRLEKTQRIETQLVETVTWEPMGGAEEASAAVVENLVQNVRKSAPRVPMTAFGTEAMRRNATLARLAEATFDQLDVRFQIISQETEAHLIRRAAMATGAAAGQDIVNAGGGSIQIIRPEGAPQLLRFGIVDLNEEFNLLGSPAHRDLTGCTEFLTHSLPEAMGSFMYTGGELTYLRHFGVPVRGGRCARDAFTTLAHRLEGLTVDQLMRDSPYDPKWMKGAIASNRIVMALLDRSGADAFVPSDLNIGHGVAAQVTQAD